MPCPAPSCARLSASKLLSTLLLGLAGWLSAHVGVHAAQVTFRWDYDASGAAGFVLYCGPSSRSYPVRIDVGNTETYTISTLTEGDRSFCAVTAYDPGKVESAFSNEISVDVPYAAPVVGFSATPAGGVAPLPVTFANNTTGQVSAWSWNFGDGDTSTVRNPTHVYDAPGNYTVSLTATGVGGTRTSSRTISVTSTGTTPGLVAAYAFEEGQGTTVADASGKGNTGTIEGATWSNYGRAGRALRFNGLNSIVKIPSSPSLNLSGRMTLEAWIYPTVEQSGWRTIVQRDVDVYFLHASHRNGALSPAGGGTFADGGMAWIAAPSEVSVNVWTHVALTYDGAMLRLYVNGVQVDSAARSGGIQTNSNQMSIGGNEPWGEFFQGKIDEVRVYNRALTAAEIQDDMERPVAPSP